MWSKVFVLFFRPFLPPKERVDLNKRGDEEGDGRAEDDEDEEVEIACEVLQPACEEARKHHAQGHETCAEGVVAGFGRALGKVEQEHHVGGEAEAVAELFEEDADVDAPQILRLSCSSFSAFRKRALRAA